MASEQYFSEHLLRELISSDDSWQGQYRQAQRLGSQVTRILNSLNQDPAAWKSEYVNADTSEYAGQERTFKVAPRITASLVPFVLADHSLLAGTPAWLAETHEITFTLSQYQHVVPDDLTAFSVDPQHETHLLLRPLDHTSTSAVPPAIPEKPYVVIYENEMGLRPEYTEVVIGTLACIADQMITAPPTGQKG